MAAGWPSSRATRSWIGFGRGKGAAGYFRRTLFRNLRLRFAPTILFRLDESLDRGDRIERVLREIHDKERTAGAPGEEE